MLQAGHVREMIESRIRDPVAFPYVQEFQTRNIYNIFESLICYLSFAQIKIIQ